MRHKACVDAIRNVLGSRVSTAKAYLQQHAKGEGHVPPNLPDAVAWVENTEEVCEVMKICSHHRCPVVPFGAGTSLEGQVNAVQGGISLDMSKMNQILEINHDDLDCLVEPGISRESLNHSLRDTGLFFPVDPGANATIGGMTSTRSSGTMTVKYGAMKDNVMGLKVVTAAGKVIRTGTRARKSSAGYDLTRLFVGSEGTLGIITQVRLRLFGVPAATVAARCPFQSLVGAVNTAIQTIQMGIPVSRIELLDEVGVDAVNRYSHTTYPVKHTLFMEFQGTSDNAVEEMAKLVRDIARDNEGLDFEWTHNEDERKQMWHARHSAHWACKSLQPGEGVRNWPTDVCVPISRLAECILGTRKDIDESGLLAPIVGHVGDGNFHAMVVYNEDDGAQLERAVELNKKIVARALALGGTCTGEHGIGLGKMQHMAEEHGEEPLEVMRSIKRALDPLNILNPGKMLPEATAVGHC